MKEPQIAPPESLSDLLSSIRDAKQKTNHAQVVLASVRHVPLNITVDESDGSPEAEALKMAYAHLCAAEQALVRSDSTMAHLNAIIESK